MHSRLFCSKLVDRLCDNLEEIQIKFLLYQILAVFVIWLGMFFFFDDLQAAGLYVFYIVTSWLLFLMVLLGKQWFRERKR